MAETGVYSVKGIDVCYVVERRRTRSNRLEFVDGELHLILPFDCDAREVLDRHKRWIFNTTVKMKKAAASAEVAQLVNRDQEEFERLVRWFVEYYEKELGVKVRKVDIRDMRSKWGSCSSSGSMRINSRLKHLPERLIRYVVYHEVSHLVRMDHSAKFWDVVEKRFVERGDLEKELLAYWLALGKLYGP
jgi:predicted metal-dependent hydrolase